MDNGPEFTGPVRLVGTDGVGLRFIQPGKPIQNAFVGTVHSAISRRNGSRAGWARPGLDEGPRPPAGARSGVGPMATTTVAHLCRGSNFGGSPRWPTHSCPSSE